MSLETPQRESEGLSFIDAERSSLLERFRDGTLGKFARALVLMSLLAGSAAMPEEASAQTEETREAEDRERESKNKERIEKFNAILQSMEVPGFTLGKSDIYPRCPCETFGVYRDGKQVNFVSSKGAEFDETSFRQAIYELFTEILEKKVDIEYGPGAEGALKQQGIILEEGQGFVCTQESDHASQWDGVMIMNGDTVKVAVEGNKIVFTRRGAKWTTFKPGVDLVTVVEGGKVTERTEQYPK